jgi:hypothetical protein
MLKEEREKNLGGRPPERPHMTQRDKRTANAILLAVERHFGVAPALVMSKDSTEQVYLARCAAAELMPWSSETTALFLRLGSQGRVYYARRTARNMCDAYPNYRRRFEAAKSEVWPEARP